MLPQVVYTIPFLKRIEIFIFYPTGAVPSATRHGGRSQTAAAGRRKKGPTTAERHSLTCPPIAAQSSTRPDTGKARSILLCLTLAGPSASVSAKAGPSATTG
jgi:hypothetical protein